MSIFLRYPVVFIFFFNAGNLHFVLPGENNNLSFYKKKVLCVIAPFVFHMLPKQGERLVRVDVQIEVK